VLQDMHCHHIRLLWEDLRAVCAEMSSIGAASGAAGAQATAAQAAVVDTAAAQAVTLWKELGTPRRAELVGLVGEVRNLRVEVNSLRTERAAATEQGITEVRMPAMTRSAAPVSPTSPPGEAPSSLSTSSPVTSPVAGESQADDLYRIEAEIRKYASAIAYFKRYENVPIGELWDDAYADGFSYWRIMPSDEQGLDDVTKQARAGFDNATEGGLTPESLALGLGRALARFKLVPHFKPLVDPMVNAILRQLGRAGAVEEPAAGANREYYVACRQEVTASAIRELQKSNLIASDFKWAPGQKQAEGTDSPNMSRDLSSSPEDPSRAPGSSWAAATLDNSQSPSRRPNMKMWRSSLSKLSPRDD